MEQGDAGIARPHDAGATGAERADERSEHPPRNDCVLICGGVWRDIDYARLELLKLLAEDPRIRTRVFENYEGAELLQLNSNCYLPAIQSASARRRVTKRRSAWASPFSGRNGRCRALSRRENRKSLRSNDRILFPLGNPPCGAVLSWRLPRPTESQAPQN